MQRTRGARAGGAQAHISPEEYAFAERIFKPADGRLDWSEFMALEMLRLGKVEMGTLEAIKSLTALTRMGTLAQSEVQAARRVAAERLVQE